MAAFQKGRCAGLFVEMMQTFLDDLLTGQTEAWSVFVGNEKARVLGDVLALVVPLLESGQSAVGPSRSIRGCGV